MFSTAAVLGVVLGLSPSSASAEGLPADFTPRIFVHLRPEVRTNPGFVAGQNDTILSVSQGLRAGLSVQQGIFEGVVDFQGTQAWGTRPGSTSAESSAYVQQGFIQVDAGKHWVRFGRQEIHLQNGWLMSRAPWNVAGRSFDGIHMHLEPGKWEVDAFSAVLRAPNPEVPGTAESLTVERSLGATHAGLFTSFRASDALEGGPIALARFEGPSVDEPEQKIWWVTPGVRMKATPGSSAVDLVVLGQVGDDSGTPMRGYTTMLRARQGLGDSPLKPGVGLIFEQNSGHGCQSDASTGTCDTDTIRNFETGFGRNHFLRGNADQFRGTNLRDLGAEVDSTLWSGGKNRSIRTTVQGHLFQLVNPEGMWMSATGALQGSGWELGNTDPNLAWELDALIDIRAGKIATLDGGLCYVQPIGVGARLTGTDAMTYAYMRNRFLF